MRSLPKFVGGFCILITMLLMATVQQGEADEPSIWQTELCSKLNDLKEGNFSKTDLLGALELQASTIDTTTAVSAILELFVRDGYKELELFWWKQENRAVRCFVMILYLCATDEGPSWIPDFEWYLERFNDKEKYEREDEYKFIMEYRSGLAGLIADILQKRDSELYHSKYKRYFGNMAKAGIGKGLPKWCKSASE